MQISPTFSALLPVSVDVRDEQSIMMTFDVVSYTYTHIYIHVYMIAMYILSVNVMSRVIFYFHEPVWSKCPNCLHLYNHAEV